MCTASSSAQPVASPLISAGEQHSRSGNPPTKRAMRRNCCRHCATARPRNCKIQKLRTKRPGRRRVTTKGTLIEAMQNAWRFVDDEVLRDRLKEAKGIGTPATRAEIIGGLKKQGFLIAQGKNIVPTETGLSLFGVLKQADPALGRSGRDRAT